MPLSRKPPMTTIRQNKIPSTGPLRYSTYLIDGGTMTIETNTPTAASNMTRLFFTIRPTKLTSASNSSLSSFNCSFQYPGCSIFAYFKSSCYTLSLEGKVPACFEFFILTESFLLPSNILELDFLR
jgi:hypothetical protein